MSVILSGQNGGHSEQKTSWEMKKDGLKLNVIGSQILWDHVLVSLIYNEISLRAMFSSKLQGNIFDRKI